MSDWVFDGLLGTGLLLLGWQTLISRDLFRSIIWFVVLGLLMTLCWVRLAAPDVALAEAAIGAGVTGALLLNAYRALLIDKPPRHPSSVVARHRQTTAWAVGLAAFSTIVVGGISWALLNLPQAGVDLGTLVRSRLAESGVSNVVTAVLLNFRGYDTLLEVAVLLLALLGVWTVHPKDETFSEASSDFAQNSPLVGALLHLLAPLLVLIGAYLLWIGAYAPGGAFQAGAVLAAFGVMLYLSGRLTPTPTATFSLKLLLIFGPGVFSLIALAVMFWGGALLEYPKDWASLLILAVETGVTISIAVTLVLLVSGSPGLKRTYQ
jgi:multisubunit Na+/H+ antiporter MnhB subunit